MTEAILIITGTVGFISGILEKFNKWDLITRSLRRLAERLNFKPLFDLSYCFFCLHFWLSKLVMIIYGLLLGFKSELFIIPFLVVGFYHLFKNSK